MGTQDLTKERHNEDSDIPKLTQEILTTRKCIVLGTLKTTALTVAGDTQPAKAVGTIRKTGTVRLKLNRSIV